MSSHKPNEGQKFSDLGVSQRMLAHLDKLQFIHPTPIQAKAIPIAIKGSDVIGIAQTGTGKTLAFSLPMIEQIAKTKRQGLVVLPTRELAIQVEETLKKIGSPFGLRVALVIGGASMGRQASDIKAKPHIIIATPGRMIDHMRSRTISLSRIGILVLDEADRMLDMGFAPQIKKILDSMPKQRQTMLFSATMPSGIFQIASRHMKTPVRVEVAKSGTVAQKIEQELFVVDRGRKSQLLDTLLREYKGTVLVFTRTKYGAKKVCRAISDLGHTASELHSNLSLPQRRKSLDGFKSGKTRVLVATDIAARGIDVTNIELVINYDLPDSPDDYVHRVGRTGRAGNAGRAISFVAPDQRGLVRVIERLVRASLPISPLPDLPAKSSVVPRDFQRRSHSQNRRSYNHSNRSSNRTPRKDRRGRARIHH